MPHHHGHRHARRHEEIERREGVKDRILDLIANLKPKEETVVSIIYVTAEPTFDGPVGGYSTEGRPVKTKEIDIAPPLEHTRPAKPEKEEPKPTKQPAPKPTPATSVHTTADSPSSRPKSAPTSFVTSTPTLDSIPTSSAGNGALGLSSVSATPSSTAAAAGAASSEGMGTGAKAGIAIGIIALVGLVAAAALLFIRKKNKNNEEAGDFDNEKPVPPVPPTASANTYTPPPPPQQQMAATLPPQLNIRPITQFSPDFTGHGPNNPSMVNVSGVVAARNLTGQPNDSQSTFAPKTADSASSNPFNDPVNPFEPRSGASSPTSAASPHVRALSFETPSMRAPTPESMRTGIAATGTAIAVGSVAVATVASGTTANGHSGKPPSLQHVAGPPPGFLRDLGPPSPALSMDSVSVTSTTAAAAAAGGAGPNNVHRVQLDFVPSMEDELELRAGQLVRLLHEYDDGWALCVRLDRSQQGVAPRSCLSARPVKPRPRNPPGPGPRGPPPIGNPNNRSMSPAGGRNSPAPGPPPQGPPRFGPQQNSRPSSPSSGFRPFPASDGPITPVSFPDVPRSLSPGPGPRFPQPRSMSPGPYGPGGMEKPKMPETQRKRSNSAAGVVGRIPAPNLGPSSLGLSAQISDVNDQPAQKAIDEPAENEENKPTEKVVDQPAEPAAQSPQTPAQQPGRIPPPSLGPVGRKPVPGQAQ